MNQKFNKNKNLNNFIFGYHTVLSTIKYMPKRSIKLYLKKKINKKNKIIIEANKKNIKFEFVPKKFIENKLKNNISHQGIMLLVKPYPYFDKEKIFHKKCKLCIIINNIKDPINFGKIIRLSLAFSVDFIAITKNKSTQISQIVEKTSSGAAAIVPIIQIGNFIQFLNFLKKEEYSIIGISNGNYTSLWKYSFSKKIAIILGSEECGINNTIKKKCSKIINIPINKSLNSINISNAAGIILYEINKQIFN